MQALLSPPSLHRRRLFNCALAAWVCSTAWLLLLFHPAPSQWPTAALVMATALGALGSAGVILELRRSLVPSAASWTDQAHLRWVLLWAAVFFVVQYTGIAIALAA
jgi:hypothetical protein